MSAVSLEESNAAVLALVQAMLGAISHNFRMVSIVSDGRVWTLNFVLDSESADDREEIEDIAAEFEALHDTGILLEVGVSICSDELPWPSAPSRVVFRRREN